MRKIITNRKAWSIGTALLLLILMKVFPSPPPAPTPTQQTGLYRVIKVVDGDTVDVDIDGTVERLRLIGIDTPETVDPRKPVQCFGKEASDHAKALLTDLDVRLEADPSQRERDKYGRLLRYVILPNGTNFNLSMIADGYAREYTYDDPYSYQADFKASEQTARSKNRGLWSTTTCNGSTSKTPVIPAT